MGTCGSTGAVDYDIKNIEINTKGAVSKFDDAIAQYNIDRAAYLAICDAKASELFMNIITTGKLFPTDSLDVNHILMLANKKIIVNVYQIIAYFACANKYPYRCDFENNVEEQSGLSAFVDELRTSIDAVRAGGDRKKIMDMAITSLSVTLTICAKTIGLKATGINEYVTNMARLIRDSRISDPCNKFVINEHVVKRIEIYDQNTREGKDDESSIIDLLEMMTCTTCGRMRDEHTACVKFCSSGVKVDINSFTESPCIVCGLDSTSHKCCVNFIKGELGNDLCGSPVFLCSTCGKDNYHHCVFRRKNGEQCCDVYTSGVDKYCARCPYSETDHHYSDDYWKLVPDDRSKVTDIFFSMSCMILSSDCNIIDRCLNKLIQDMIFKTLPNPTT